MTCPSQYETFMTSQASHLSCKAVAKCTPECTPQYQNYATLLKINWLLTQANKMATEIHNNAACMSWQQQIQVLARGVAEHCQLSVFVSVRALFVPSTKQCEDINGEGELPLNFRDVFLVLEADGNEQEAKEDSHTYMVQGKMYRENSEVHTAKGDM